MDKLARLPKNKLYLLLFTCAMVIFAASMEVLFLVKDSEMYALWARTMLEIQPDQPVTQFSFDNYVASNLFQYFLRILTPVALGIHSYFAYLKLGINNLFVFIWAVLVAGGAAYALIGANVYSVFFYLVMAGYVILFFTVLSLHDAISGTGTTEPYKR